MCLKKIDNNENRDNARLTKEFYGAFWDDHKKPFLSAINQAKITKRLITSLIIKLIEKKDRAKRHIKVWRPVSLQNLDYKVISKDFAARLKEVLPDLISSQQTAYLTERFLGEITRLIPNLLEIPDKLKFDVYLVTIAI